MAEIVQIGKDRFRFQCPQCSFWRVYSTLQGGLTKAAEHCAAVHHLRLELERKPDTVRVRGIHVL